MSHHSSLFVTCGRGLEELLMRELKLMGFTQLRIGCRGVYVDGVQFHDCYRINYCSRVASRVLWPLIHFRCANRETLYGTIADLPWEELIAPGATLAIDSNVSSTPQLQHSHFAALVVKDAICDRLRSMRGQRPSIDREDPTVQLNLYIECNYATLSWDTSGKPLHQRGYRQEAGGAPLQENLAAGLLMLNGYKGYGAFCDPMCGSGTLIIEAAMMASATPPGFLRKQWGFTAFPDFSQQEWLRTKNSADALRREPNRSHFWGVEKHPLAIEACRKNLRATGLDSFVTLSHSDFVRWDYEGEFDWIVTNPPYGVRMTLDPELPSQLASFIESRTTPKSRSLVLLPVDVEPCFPPLAIKRRSRLSNGGLPIQVVTLMLS